MVNVNILLLKRLLRLLKTSVKDKQHSMVKCYDKSGNTLLWDCIEDAHSPEWSKGDIQEKVLQG